MSPRTPTKPRLYTNLCPENFLCLRDKAQYAPHGAGRRQNSLLPAKQGTIAHAMRSAEHGVAHRRELAPGHARNLTERTWRKPHHSCQSNVLRLHQLFLAARPARNLSGDTCESPQRREPTTGMFVFSPLPLRGDRRLSAAIPVQCVHEVLNRSPVVPGVPETA